jgi:hypothetical protein
VVRLPAAPIGSELNLPHLRIQLYASALWLDETGESLCCVNSAEDPAAIEARSCRPNGDPLHLPPAAVSNRRDGTGELGVSTGPTRNQERTVVCDALEDHGELTSFKNLID